MKKKFLPLFILSFVICFSSFAGDFRFGLHINPALSWMKSDVKEISFGGMRPAFNYGVMFDYDFSDNYAFATGITISHNGGAIDYNQGGVLFPETFPNDSFPPGSGVKYNLQHLEIPLGLKLKTNQIGYITYFAQVGFNTRLNLKGVADVNTDDPNADINDEKVKDDITLITLGWEVGGGIEYSLGGTTSFYTGIYFNNGITDIIDTEAVSGGAKGKVIVNYLALRLGVIF